MAININPANKGKFTASAKAAGEGVQEHARKVRNNPRSSAKQKKRAVFAANAKKWARNRKRGHKRKSSR